MVPRPVLQPQPDSQPAELPRRLIVANAVHEVIRCKWSLQILDRVRAGTRRPGAIRRSCPGLSTKVMNERLAKLVRLGILERRAFPEIPPRVEYYFTPFGRRFTRILAAIDRLQAEVDRAGLQSHATGPGRNRA
jgi:DNA-binding HxlR family transcriptional regulator